jgi:hypothetical protein
MAHLIRGRAYVHDTERLAAERLLKLEVPVHCQQRLEPTSGAAQQFPVRHTLPTEPGYRRGLVPSKLRREIHREVLVKQDAHEP